MHPKINLIAAACENLGIGINNDLPWRLKKEMAYFTRMTTSTISPDKKNAVIMGRKTWQSIPLKFRPLAGRVNIVLTSNNTMDVGNDAIVCDSLQSAIDKINNAPLSDSIESVWIIGGCSVYQEAMKSAHCHRIYLTSILKQFNCDTFFPQIGKDFRLITDPNVPAEKQVENGIEYEFRVFERI